MRRATSNSMCICWSGAQIASSVPLQGWAAAERNIANVGSLLEAIDYKTGRVRWSRPLAIGPNGSMGGAMGLLSTAGGGLNGAYVLNKSTVFADGVTDVLLRGDGQTWDLLSKTDVLDDKESGDHVTQV